MMDHILFYLIEFLFHFTLLLVTLWIMIKIQGFNYNFPGLLGTAAAGGALDMIPFVGHPLAVVALYFCITKMTRASMFPDASFTVAVSYALMFAVKMLAFTALMGDLRPSSIYRNESPSDEPPSASQTADDDSQPADATNQPSVAASQPVAAASQPVAAASQPALPAGPPATAAQSKAAAEFIHKLVVKGAVWNGEKSSATLQFAGKVYVVLVGDKISLKDQDKPVQLELENVKSRLLTFKIDGATTTCAYQ